MLEARSLTVARLGRAFRLSESIPGVTIWAVPNSIRQSSYHSASPFRDRTANMPVPGRDNGQINSENAKGKSPAFFRQSSLLVTVVSTRLAPVLTSGA
jgi:hypothetical protein